MRKLFANFLLCLCTALFSLCAFAASDAQSPDDTRLLGFTAQGSTQQRALEQQFDASLSAQDQSDWDRQMSSEPNQLGSPHDKANAEWTLKQFQDWGWDAHIETFHVLFPTPKERVLELIAPTKYTASLSEPPVAGDKTSQQSRAGILPPYNAYAADGDVTGELVYVNYGIPDDYKVLERHGISVKGKIVIARYGHSWRGIKPVVAYQHGAIGCIIYSDPRDDGYWQGDAYPQGAWRSAEGVQRGSVAKMQIHPGDPETPGYGSTAGARRETRAQSETLLKIPVLPISWADAKPLLAALGGPVVPPEWRGALPLTYHLGPGPAKVHLKLAFNWNVVPAYDVIAKIRGSEYPDQWVIRGNHRDGWVFGAFDPLAGHVAMLDEARAIGKLLKTGWRPKRTLVYASWDGEEPGLLGSTEWAETHAAELQKKAVLYLNSDTNGRGYLFMGGSHSLQPFIDQVGRGIRDPETGVNVMQRRRARIAVDAHSDNASARERDFAKQVAAAADFPIDALGSGSDYSAFLQHLGIATLDMGYGGEDGGGEYHSLYDSFDHYRRFGDPGFKYGVALSQTAGHTVLRFADAPVLPFRYAEFADTVGEYVDQVRKLADSKRAQAVEQDKLLDQGAYRLARDPAKPTLAPPRAGRVPYLDFAPLDNALVKLKASADACDAAFAARVRAGSALDDTQREKLNALLQGMEQALLDARGLPGRSWYKHMIYAPGLYTGYGVKTLPGVREAIEQKQWDTATRYVGIIAHTLDGYSARLDKATAILKQ
ncbi:MAG TPA: transferrin receptor-like dimerization domain-containing protein [Gammaproteobacteria bacterium]|nr:transferrin receptor-like dimerization domain-containing protein [Gammaproteobacteria bacterium]